MDSSLRETNPGALEGYTLEKMRKVYEEIRKCDFKYFTLGSFTRQSQVEELFLNQLIADGDDLSRVFFFTEVWDNIQNKVPQSQLPQSLMDCWTFGVKNVIFEIDLNSYKIDYENFNVEMINALFKERVNWVRKLLSPVALIFVHIRDFSSTMQNHQERVEEFVRFLSTQTPEDRIFGILFEDLGDSLPTQLEIWTRAVRQEMDQGGWKDGHLLFHQQEKWGLMHAANLGVLASGADGMMTAVCKEGAGMGHADSCTAITNLIRLGNRKVLDRYNCK